ncbi:hypothetical protein DPMN_132477 [Dreissena polymorpha]|uniref:B box-type domain-containing protein n=1 Tax=Dreissena polymorpha TaxID=45954 RepID=A0A9D4FWT7_DREPO|nr:hypothetical protein DPMN_132477 [Dreissena polymorpha]
METTQEIENQKQESNSDMIGEGVVIKQCEACLQVNISVEATLFCTSCSECVCDECKNGHVRYKSGTHEFADAKLKYASVNLRGLDKCEEHKKKIKFFCNDHSLMCCSTCAFSYRTCEHIDELAKIATDIGPKLKTLKDELAKAAHNERVKIENCKQMVKALNIQLGDLPIEIDETKKKITKLLDEACLIIIKEAKQTVDTECKRIGERQFSSETVLQSMVDILPLCSEVVKNGTPQQMFILTRYLTKKLQEIIIHDKEQQQNHFSLELALYVSTDLSSLLRGRDAVKLVVRKCNQVKGRYILYLLKCIYRNNTC